MLSVEIKENGKAIQIDCDDAGIDVLIDRLSKLRGSGGHTHLCAPSAGGDILSEQTPWGSPAVFELIISHG